MQDIKNQHFSSHKVIPSTEKPMKEKWRKNIKYNQRIKAAAFPKQSGVKNKTLD